MPELNTWSEKMEAIIEKQVEREDADKLAWKCAEIADIPEVERAKPDRPLQSYKHGVKRSVAVIFGDLAFDDLIRTLDDAKNWLRRCGMIADEVSCVRLRRAGQAEGVLQGCRPRQF